MVTDAEATELARLRKCIAKAHALLAKWAQDHSPPGDAAYTPADICLDNLGEALGLWGEDS